MDLPEPVGPNTAECLVTSLSKSMLTLILSELESVPTTIWPGGRAAVYLSEVALDDQVRLVVDAGVLADAARTRRQSFRPLN